VIDSFKALHAFADSHSEFRRFLHELAGRLSAFPVASLWVGEYEEAEVGSLPEFAVADAIVDLATERIGHRGIRFLTVRNYGAAAFRPASTHTGSAEAVFICPAARRRADRGVIRAGRYPGFIGHSGPG
jgi:circadian clock protein KaiC